jgi:hypothetical protein
VFDAVELLRQRWFDLELERQKRDDIAGLDVDRAVLDAEKYVRACSRADLTQIECMSDLTTHLWLT